MDFAPAYLAGRFFYRFGDFFHHWYIDGSRAIGRRFMATLTGADQTFAVRVTLRYFWHPLYGDYTVIGRILGVIFRTGRLLIGAAFYVILAALFLLFYIAWLAFPVATIFYALYYGTRYGF